MFIRRLKLLAAVAFIALSAIVTLVACVLSAEAFRYTLIVFALVYLAARKNL